MSEFTFITQDAEAIISLSRPECGNALSIKGIRLLADTLWRVGSMTEIKIVRIRAEGQIFCNGREKPPMGMPPKVSAQEIRGALVDPIIDVYRALRALNVPCVAQVQGAANGFGCALVAGCDLAVASDNATFTLPEMSNDLPPTLALSALGRKVHEKAAASLVFGLAQFDAHTALAVGLVGEVVSPSQLADRVDEIVAQVSLRHPVALATVKSFQRTLNTADFEQLVEIAASEISTALSSIRGGVE